jgi:hypothetical protein
VWPCGDVLLLASKCYIWIQIDTTTSTKAV